MPEDPCGWVKLFHPSGAQVTLPLLPGISEEYAKEIPKVLFDQVSRFVESGFTVNAPGLEEGEQSEEVGAVLRSNFEKDGEITPVVLLYSSNDKLEWAILKVYLNKDDDVAAFQKASGLRLNDLPIYDGSDKLKWDDSQKAKKYIIRAPRPFKVVVKSNPNYKEEERAAAVAKGGTYTKPKRIFVRWGDAKAGAAPAQETPQEVADKATVNWWVSFFADNPEPKEVNSRLDDIIALEKKTNRTTMIAVKNVLKEYADNHGWEYDKEHKVFVPPKPIETESYDGGDTGHDDPIPF